MTFDAAESKTLDIATGSAAVAKESANKSLTLPHQCRQMTIERVGKAISNAHDKVVDELYDLAEQSLDRDSRDFYLQAKEDWPTLRSRIETRLRERLETLFDDRVASKKEEADAFAHVQTSWMDLSLVADGDLEESMRFTDISARIKSGIEEELSALDQRMAALLGKPGMESHDNPVAPMAICDAYRSALGAVESGLKVKLLLIRTFDLHARGDIAKFYKELNALLKDNGVLPTIRHGSLKKPVGGTGPVSGPKAAGPQVVGSVTLPIVADAAGAQSGASAATLSVPLNAGVAGAVASGTPLNLSSATATINSAASGAGSASATPALPQDPFAMLQQLMMTVASAHGNGGTIVSGGAAQSEAGLGSGVSGGGVPGATGSSGGLGGGAPGVVGQGTGGAIGGADAGRAGGSGIGGTGTGAGGSLQGSPGVGGGMLGGTQLIGSLTRLQHGDFTALPDDLPAALEAAGWGGIGGGAVGASSGDADGMQGTPAISGRAKRDVARAQNILHKLKATSLGSQMGQMDTVTLDIVAMLFDQIFGDARVPAAMKALISRLQIPMLKVAVIDKAFFSKKTHPARRTLDTLGELSLGLGENFDAESSLYKRIDMLVQRLVDEFEEDFGVFDHVTEALESLIADANVTAERVAKRDSKRIQDKERLAVARIFAQNEIKQRVQNQALPRAVLRFLMVDWMKLLILAYAKGGRESRAWHSLVETLDILVWSIAPKQKVEDRKRLVALLPSLLKRIEKGMEIIGTTASNRERFNQVLMRCHAKAISGVDVAFADVELPLPTERKVKEAAASAAANMQRSAIHDVATTHAPDNADSTTIAIHVSGIPTLPHMMVEEHAPFDANVPTLVPESDLNSDVMKVEEISDGIPTLNPLDQNGMVYVTADPAPEPLAASQPEHERTIEEVLDAMLPENIAEAATIQEEMAQTEAPDNFPALAVRNPFGDGEIQVEEVSFGDLPGFASSINSAALVDNGDKYTQTARAMKEGDWIEIRDEDRLPVQARLSYLSPYGGTYVFANRKGVKLAEMSLYQLTRDLRCGRIVPIEDVPLFDRAFGGLVGMLKKSAAEAA